MTVSLFIVLRERTFADALAFLSHSNGPERIVRAIGVGAVGWVRKDESFDRLINIIRGVARGETWLPTDQTGEVLRPLMRGSGQGDDSDDQLLAMLRDRVRDVLLCLGEGNRRRDVAEHLHVSPNTIRTDLQNRMGKLGVHTVLEAVALTRQVPDADFRTERGM